MSAGTHLSPYATETLDTISYAYALTRGLDSALRSLQPAARRQSPTDLTHGTQVRRAVDQPLELACTYWLKELMFRPATEMAGGTAINPH